MPWEYTDCIGEFNEYLDNADTQRRISIQNSQFFPETESVENRFVNRRNKISSMKDSNLLWFLIIIIMLIITYNADIENTPLIDFDEDYYEEEEEEEEDKALMSFDDDRDSPSHSWYNRYVCASSLRLIARKFFQQGGNNSECRRSEVYCLQENFVKVSHHETGEDIQVSPGLGFQ